MFDFKGFAFTGFTNPEQSNFKNAFLKESGASNATNWAPHQINQDNWSTYIDFKFTRNFPSGTKFTPHFDTSGADNLAGQVSIDYIDVNQVYSEDSYDKVQIPKPPETTFKIPAYFKISGFRKCNPTSLNSFVYVKDNRVNLENQIKNFLVNQNMIPKFNYNVGNITANVSGDEAIVSIYEYYDNGGNYINSRISGTPPYTTTISLVNGSVAKFPETLSTPNVITSTFASPYAIKLSFEDPSDSNHDILINVLQQTISGSITGLGFIPQNAIEILNIQDYNFTNGKGKIDVTYNYIDGASTTTKMVTFIGINYVPVSFSLKQLQFKAAADFITASNFKEYVQVSNPLPKVEYLPKKTTANYKDGIETIYFSDILGVNKETGQVESNQTLSQELEGFTKVDPTEYEFVENYNSPCGVALTPEYLQKYYMPKPNQYTGIRFANNTSLVPEIQKGSFKVTPPEDKSESAQIEFEINNFIDDLGVKHTSPLKVTKLINVLPTNKGIYLMNIDDNIQLDETNVYQYLNILPTLRGYFGLTDQSALDPNVVKQKLEAKGYSISVEPNQNVQLYRNGNLIGKISKASLVIYHNPWLKILFIVLIVVGIIGIGVVITFIVLSKKINKKANALKTSKANGSTASDEVPTAPVEPSSETTN